MRRARVYLAIGFTAFVFLAITFLLARSLSATARERDDVVQLVKAEARGDVATVLASTPACRREPACAAATAQRVRKLTRPGTIEILQYVPSAQIALTRRIGTGRVAWRAGTSLPVVQCVRVRRDGPLTGGSVELLSISAPIARDGSC